MIIKSLGMQDYLTTYQQMCEFTQSRNKATPDELWILQHNPVYTQGYAGKPEHILRQSNIPIVQTDRGGQVTYHGPGQLVVYFLIDLKRADYGLKGLMERMQQATIGLLNTYRLVGIYCQEAPGIYIDGKKICSYGLRVKRGCSYHGLSFNVKMDMNPFNNINPCGLKKIQMVQLADYQPDIDFTTVENRLLEQLQLYFDPNKRELPHEQHQQTAEI